METRYTVPIIALSQHYSLVPYVIAIGQQGFADVSEERACAQLRLEQRSDFKWRRAKAYVSVLEG